MNISKNGLQYQIPDIETLQNNVSANGNGVESDILPYGQVLVEVIGTFAADIICEVSQDQVTRHTIKTIQSAGLYILNTKNAKYFRARVANYASGNITVKIQPLPTGSNSNTFTPDGGNVALGSTSDAAVTSDSSGTITGFLRGLVKIFSNVWDSTLPALKVTLASKLTKTEDSIEARIEGGTPTQVTGSQQIAGSSGRLRGIFVSAASSTPTIKLWNNTAGNGAVLVDTFTPVAGTPYNFFDMKFSAGLYITISGTVNCVVVTT